MRISLFCIRGYCLLPCTYKKGDQGLQPIEKSITTLEAGDIWGGFKHLMPISLFVIIFGIAFGLAAARTGLSEASSLAMSALVFAGASQFAVLEQWGDQVPLIPLVVTVFAVNARHLLMGATLFPWLRDLPGQALA